MKKLLAVCLSLGLTLNLSGCAVGDLIDKFTNIHNSDESEISAPKQRVYMDELKGTLVDFTGNTITIEANEENYFFNVSDATLECQNGMITGDEISIIYEGKLSDSNTDTSSVQVLKVVSDYHNQAPIKESVALGTLQNITANTITIEDESGVSATYPITGAEEYFTEGIQKDMTVYIHYYGKLNETSSQKVLNANHVKVISISDIDPLLPPTTEETSTEHTGGNQLHATIQSLSLNALAILLPDGSAPISLDVSQVPCYFQGGTSSGTSIAVNYSGSFNGTSSEGISAISIAAEPAKKNKAIESLVSGIIMASTANTITLQTSDGAVVTCNIENIPDLSSNVTEIGTGVKATFDPFQNRTSNIYICTKLEEI